MPQKSNGTSSFYFFSENKAFALNAKIISSIMMPQIKEHHNGIQRIQNRSKLARCIRRWEPSSHQIPLICLESPQRRLWANRGHLRRNGPKRKRTRQTLVQISPWRRNPNDRSELSRCRCWWKLRIHRDVQDIRRSRRTRRLQRNCLQIQSRWRNRTPSRRALQEITQQREDWRCVHRQWPLGLEMP